MVTSELLDNYEALGKKALVVDDSAGSVAEKMSQWRDYDAVVVPSIDTLLATRLCSVTPHDDAEDEAARQLDVAHNLDRIAAKREFMRLASLARSLEKEVVVTCDDYVPGFVERWGFVVQVAPKGETADA